MKKTSALSIIFIILCLALSTFVGCDINDGGTPGDRETEDVIGNGNVENPGDESSDDEVNENEFEFKDIDSTSCVLTKAIYVSGDVVIPNTSPDGLTVTKIGDEAFMGCKDIVSVTFPASVTQIGNSAFKNCESLEKVFMGGGIKKIDVDAFHNCTALEEVHMNDLYKWCNITFSNSYSNPVSYAHKLYLDGELITDLVIPKGVWTVRAYSFEYCYYLESVVIPDDVEKIEYGAFSCCKELKSVEMTDSVKTIGSYAFYFCTKLQSVPNLDGVKTIDSYAFSQCESIETLNIPKGIENIGEYAFVDCVGLKELTVENGDQIIDALAFKGCKDIQKMSLPSSLLSKVQHGELVELNVTKGTSILPEACCFDTKLKSAVIGENIESIGARAFKGCSSLEEITLPVSLTKIGNNAFEYCASLETVNYAGSEEEWNLINGIDEIPDNVKIIFNYTAN